MTAERRMRGKGPEVGGERFHMEPVSRDELVRGTGFSLSCECSQILLLFIVFPNRAMNSFHGIRVRNTFLNNRCDGCSVKAETDVVAACPCVRTGSATQLL